MIPALLTGLALTGTAGLLADAVRIQARRARRLAAYAGLMTKNEIRRANGYPASRSVSPYRYFYRPTVRRGVRGGYGFLNEFDQ